MYSLKQALDSKSTEAESPQTAFPASRTPDEFVKPGEEEALEVISTFEDQIMPHLKRVIPQRTPSRPE